ncbi:hypothetical protein ABEB36_001687 [Hypothenemus hampei]|uniref:Uncharacterized protein n=1 Tax=Hypothenemus hampei TaxID=57062 RepID=A0ABD1FG08_HYPHA
MKYVKRYNKFDFQTNCRVCLTQSMSKIPLDFPLKDEEHSPLIFQALETLSNEKVHLLPNYPSVICGMCMELLKIAYDLIMRYHHSKMKLQKYLSIDESNRESPKKQDKKLNEKAPVEIIVGDKKINIRDVLVIEDGEESDDQCYEGFLKNLGKSVSASFAKKNIPKKKLLTEPPNLVIEKITPGPVEHIKIENDSLEDDCIVEPVSDTVLEKLQEISEKDKGIYEAALNLKYKCPHCKKPMASLNRAKTHTRNCHLNSINVTCFICDKRFRSRKILLEHSSEAHFVKLRPRNSKEKFKCRKCGKLLSSQGSLSYHMSKHLGKRYSCDKCDKRFYTKNQARSHKQVHNPEKTVTVCPVCGKGFHYRTALHYHLKIHRNERNIQCSFCPKRFYTRNSVKRHELTHTGERPYNCQFCEKKFRSLGEVKQHKILHTGERPFQCSYCNMTFTHNHNLKVHSLTHPGQYKCMQCTKTFVDVEILRFHLKSKHQIEATIVADDQQEIEDNLIGAQLDLNEETFYIAEEYEMQEHLVLEEFNADVLVETVDEN